MRLTISFSGVVLACAHSTHTQHSSDNSVYGRTKTCNMPPPLLCMHVLLAISTVEVHDTLVHPFCAGRSR